MKRRASPALVGATAAVLLAGAFMLLPAFIGLGAPAPASVLGRYGREFFALDTYIEITLYASSEAGAEAALDVAEQIFMDAGRLMTRYPAGRQAGASDVARVNAGAGGVPTPIGAETFGLLRRALDYCAASGGAFDISLGALSDLWDFRGEARVPGGAEIERTLALSGYKKITLDESGVAVSIPAGLQIDLGGIAKGYATQKAADAMRAMGVAHAIIDAGGDLYALGCKPPTGDGSQGGGAAPADASAIAAPWIVGIRHPRDEGALLATLPAINKAVVTSGDYERFFLDGGERFCHILDPKTGWPARACVSATVIADDATLADYLSTAVFVLGPVDGLALVAGIDGAEAVVVGADMRVSVSPGLEGIISMATVSQSG